MDQEMLVNGNAYTVKELLGKGKGGYSYLVEKDGREYVLKQIHHEPCEYYQFGDKIQAELRDYERLSRIGIPMPRLIAVDAERERIVKEYIPGDTIQELVQTDRMREEYLVQIREMCQKLYPANTNIDYYPTNFIPWQGVLYYIDYECNDYMQEWDFEHWGSQYWVK